MVIDTGRQQIVARSNRMRVARQMEVDVFHRDDLCASASCSASFDAEDRPQRWLTEGHHGARANSIEPIARPMEVVVFPSPNGVGLMAVTRIYRPRGLCFSRSSAERLILPLCLPYGC